MQNLFFFRCLMAPVILLPAFYATACRQIPAPQQQQHILPSSVAGVPLPAGYERVSPTSGSFGSWLGKMGFRKDNTVYLYNHEPKQDQSSHYAVLDLSTGNEDLQQCADAIMRLRAEYFFSQKAYRKIDYPASGAVHFNFERYIKGERYRVSGQKMIAFQTADTLAIQTHDQLLKFLRQVFIYCGTYTVEEQTYSIKKPEDLQPGDVFVKAGYPGHAMIVMDVAVNKSSGDKIFLLAQGFMPAQDMHIVKNPLHTTNDPWYSVTEISEQLFTPGYTFNKAALRRWK